MHIEKINYQRTFNLGSYESVRIGAEVMINAGEDAKKAFEVAKNFVEEFQKENHPHTYGHDSTPDIPIIPKQPEEKSMTPYEVAKSLDMPLDAQIATCDDIEILKSYKFIVKGKPELEKIYSEKLKELSK